MNIECCNSHDEDDMYFDPSGYDDSGVLKCCCGFPLYKEDENTWRCEGGNHRYRIDEDEMFLGVNGQLMFKKPSEHRGDKAGGKEE